MRNSVLIVIFVCSFFYLRLMKTGVAKEPTLATQPIAPAPADANVEDPAIQWLFLLSLVSVGTTAAVAVTAYALLRSRRVQPVLVFEQNEESPRPGWILRNVGAAPATNIGIFVDTPGDATPQFVTCTASLQAGQQFALDWIDPVASSERVLAVQYSDIRNAHFCAQMKHGLMRFESRWPWGDMHLQQKPAVFLFRRAA